MHELQCVSQPGKDDQIVVCRSERTLQRSQQDNLPS